MNTLFSWSKYPLLRIFIPYIGGVMLAFSLRNTLIIPDFLGIIIIVISLLSLFICHIFITFKRRLFFGLILANLMVWIGYFNTQTHITNYLPPESILNLKRKTLLMADVNESPIWKENNIKLSVKIKKFYIDSQQHSGNFKMVLYLQRDSLSKTISYGDRLLCYVYPNNIPFPKNPDEFNYKKYLEIKYTHLQAYASCEAWTRIGQNKGNPFMNFANKLQKKLLKLFDDSHLNKNENAVISAILLGADDKMDADLIRSYSNTGVSHILSVSGMHVGIIYMILYNIFFFLHKNKQQKTLKACIILLIIWLYACITGLSPPVMRASCMFSFFAIANIIQRKGNIFNSLFSSLLLLTLWNPLLIFDMGLQLSYAAVFGIVWMEKIISDKYKPKTKVGRYFWDIICVSLAAQLFTFPLSLFYFHQFPLYFLLANMAIISITPLIVTNGMFLLLFSFWQWAYDGLAYTLNLCIKCMNIVIQTIESFPFASLQIHMTLWQTIGLYIFIISLIYSFLYKHKKAFFLSILCFLMIFFVDLIKYINNLHNNEIIFYALPKGMLIDCIDAQTCYIVGDSSTLSNKKAIDYHVKNHRIKHQIKRLIHANHNEKTIQFLKIGNIVSFKGKRIFITDTKTYINRYDTSVLNINYLFINNYPNLSIRQIIKTVNPDLVIFSVNNDKYKIKKWEKDCNEYNVPFYDLQNGALKITLK